MKRLFTLLVSAFILLTVSCSGVNQRLLKGYFDEYISEYQTTWYGGVVGSSPDFLYDIPFKEMSVKALKQIYESNSIVEYRSIDGRIQYRAQPIGDYYRHKNLNMDCLKVIEEAYRNRKFVKSVERTVCARGKKGNRFFNIFCKKFPSSISWR